MIRMRYVLQCATLAIGFWVVCGAVSAQDEKGLSSIFFEKADLTDIRAASIETKIDANTGTRISDYSRLWLGKIEAPIQGSVKFVAEADNGIRLKIGDRTVIDGWSQEGAREGVFEFPKAGEKFPFRFEFFQDGGIAYVRLFWEWQGHARELVPASAFSHSKEDLPKEEIVPPKDIPEVGNGRVVKDHALLYQPGEPKPSKGPIKLEKGPHLFLDDYLVAKSENVERVVNTPPRDPNIPNPIVSGNTGPGDGCFQPYMTILRDPDTERFRIWYGRTTEDDNSNRSRIGYMESEDGIHWERPAKVLDEASPIQFGVAVIDMGPDYKDPNTRYKYGWHMHGGLMIATSPDGLNWTSVQPFPVLKHSHDINGIWFDPIRQRYLATLSLYRESDVFSGKRRITTHSYSDDLVHWAPERYVIVPDQELDEGETQFYAIDGYLARGDLLIGMVKVLRDDLHADNPPDPPDAYGLGYTTLAWTRDGETWYRDREPFFDRHPTKGEWDHAHAWIDEQLPVGDEVFLYYGGYKSGHKVNRFEERQIGLVKIGRDRYVAREAGDKEGTLQTPPVQIEGNELTLNADASNGEIRVGLVDDKGKAIPGFGFEDCEPIKADSLDAKVQWKKDLADLKGKTVSIEFRLSNASLYAIGVN